MRIELVPPLELAPADEAAWEAIRAGEPAFDSPYLSPEWPRALARAGGPDARGARVAVARDARGEAMAFLPARVGRFTAGPAGAPVCDVQALVGRPDAEVDPAALARALGVGRLDLANFAAPPAAWRPHVKAWTETLRIDVSHGYDAYARERREAGSGILSDAAKKGRKLQREHGEPRFTACSPSGDDLRTLVGWKRAQYRATGQTDIFDAGWPGRLLEQLHASPDPSWGGRLFTLHVGEELAAAHYALQDGGVLHAWFIAHAEPWARYSPGLLLIVEILRWAERAGVRALDLGPGDYRFKQSLANVRTPLALGFVGRPSPAAAVRGVAWWVRQAAEARPESRYAELPGKAMRRLDLVRSLRG